MATQVVEDGGTDPSGTPTAEDAPTDEREGRSGDPRPEKVAVVDEVRDELSSNPATILTEYRGLSVGELAELRGALRDAGANYVVVKNTLARIAARDAGYEELVDFLTGPTALTYCADDPVGPAKALRRFSKDHPELVVKGGILEGRVVDAETADKLADLESREDLLAHLARLMYGALANTASLFEAPLSKMARLLAAYEEEGDLPEGEAPAETAAADDEPAETEAPEATETEDPEAAEAAEEPDTVEPETAEESASDETAEEDQPEATETEEPEAAEAAEEPASDEAESAGTVETVADTAAGAVETAADVADTAVEAAAETAKDVAEDTPVEGAVEAAAEVTETVTGAATDTVEGAAETAADAVAGSDEDDAADADDDETDDEDQS